mmetsp:Transcript_44578/g.66148  ORF Transcript_44578/g.66148 Transcript_44578/m.66148 type:complete len:150 (-) Transcript_44578:137-586(-)|eukprot:CAMPEP_0194045612 /NCGR_PEP_ID=MMETSP0009_2-20130614/16889_1 /TAXON_ID=210454 /ORGANISM="Grammatophora oceanica, Strain CCMP 410" /LENGTH=149 /DNA_ID=CAMNT_0038690499 /DNA_START=91 /DNA_END=540 /DNA_ORIENTATION=+
MKITAAFIIASLTAVSAFNTPSRPAFVSRNGVQLYEKVDTSAAVKDALAASEKFGSTSAEAKAAWDIVEELDASNSHQAKAPTATATETPEAASTGDADFKITTAAEALKAAKAITEEKGITSPDARIAWELVEELAATETHHKEVGSG